MSDTVAVSVIVTCYNLGRYLEEAVESVLRQTFDDFEILVVDDGSTEPATVALLGDYRRPRTRVVRTDNLGPPGAKNFGIARTTGRYVCTLDADDVLEPTWLEKAVRRLDEDASLAFVSHWYRAFGDEAWEFMPDSCELPSLLEHNTVNGAALVRRQALEAVGGFDESLRHGSEDWALWLAMVERGLKGAIIPEFLFHYRRRADSVSRVMLEEGAYLDSVRVLLERHRDSYRRHAVEILLMRDRRTCALLRENADLEVEHDTHLAPALARRRAEVEALRGKAARVAERRALAERAEGLERELAAARAREADLEAARLHAEGELAASRAREAGLAAARLDAEREAAALRASLSWKVTAPLRQAFDRLTRRRRGRGPWA